MVTKIAHIGIAVANLEESVKLFLNVLGLEEHDIERESVNNMKVAMIPVGESQIELLEPMDSDGVIAKFIAKRGEGIHHIAIGVSNIMDELNRLKAKSVPLVDTEPKIGAGGHRVAFLHPKAAKVLLELVEDEPGEKHRI